MEQLFRTEPDAEPVAGYARIAIEQGIDAQPNGLTYALRAELADVAVGDRVVVPLGRRNKPVVGYVVATGIDAGDTGIAPGKIKPILSRDPQGLSIGGGLSELARWLSGYYCCPLGMVFCSMLPAAVKRGKGLVKRVMVTLPTEDVTGDEAAESDEAAEQPKAKFTKLQRAVLQAAERLSQEGRLPVEIHLLAELAGARSDAPVRKLIDRGYLASHHAQTVRASGTIESFKSDRHGHDIALTETQRSVLDELMGRIDSGFSVNLLHGVTGSGKTEVYLRLIAEVLARGDDAGAIVLVPEIALTPQTVARFEARFEGVAVLHSGLTASQRHEQWKRVQSGQVRIVVGARSAVFAPMPRVGVIIVDEEHDNSYKQDQLPRYHARDVAIKRAQLLGIPVVLGSATPSLESYHNATGVSSGKAYHLLRLPDRVTGRGLPKVEIVDMNAERRHRRGVHLLSQRLEHEVTNAVTAGGQAMLLLNRRGYANYIACPDPACGWLMNCDHCDVMMVYHKDESLRMGGQLRCHHCRAEQLLPAECPQCGKRVTVFGLGTQRVEEEIERKFPALRLLRMDSDTMRTAGDYHAGLEAFGRGEIDLLIGTQMIAKGLDYPNVRLVGVISADSALHVPDFRAAERGFQLIAQVAGRAGRGSHESRVIVQTLSTDDPVIGFAAAHDYEGFAASELEVRIAAGLPPSTRMVRIVIRDQDALACHEHARTLTERLDAANQSLGLAVNVRGPAPCPIGRIAGFFRVQIELIGPDAASLQSLMTHLRNAGQLRADSRAAIDPDPVDLL